MNQEQFFEQLHQNFISGLELMKRKNMDYAGNHEVFHNFHSVERFGICAAEIGILVRMSDKMARIANLIDQPASVSAESLSDTLTDLMNYANILKVYLDNKKTLTSSEKKVS